MTDTPSGADPTRNMYGCTPCPQCESLRAEVERLRAACAEQRVLGHGEGQEHAIADVNAGRIDDLIAPRLLAARAEPSPQPEHLCQFTQPRQPRPCPEQHPMKHEEWCGACLMQMYDPDRFAEVLKAARVLVGSSQTQK